jgi:hypothetical protein
MSKLYIATLLVLVGCGRAGGLDELSSTTDGGSGNMNDLSAGGGCGKGQTTCGTTCADLQSDPKNCGKCGLACSAKQVCSQGACASSCARPHRLQRRVRRSHQRRAELRRVRELVRPELLRQRRLPEDDEHVHAAADLLQRHLHQHSARRPQLRRVRQPLPQRPELHRRHLLV